MNDLLGRLVVVLGLDLKEFRKNMAAAQTSMSRFRRTVTTGMAKIGTHVKNAGWSLRRMGIDISTYLIAPMALVGASAFNLYKGFESSMTKINSLVGVAREQISAWNKDVLELSKSTGRGPKELADALYFVTSAGVRGAEAIEVLTASAKAATAGLGETKNIADLLTSAVNAYGKENITAAHAADVLVGAVREGKAEAADFTQVMGRLLPVASNMGVELNEVAAATAALTRTGSQSAEAATYLRRMLFTLEKPSQDAIAAFGDMETSVEAVRDVFRNKGLMEGLLHLKGLMEDNNQEMSRVFRNVRAYMGVIDLLGNNLNENINIFRNLNNVLGLNQKAFDTASETLEVKFNKRIATGKIELIRLGKAMKGPVLDAIDKLLGQLQYLSEAFHSMTDAQKESAIQTTINVAKAGLLSTAVSILMITFGNAVKMLASLTNMLLANPWALAIAGAAALGFAIYKFVNNMKEQNVQLSASERALQKADEQYSKNAGAIQNLVSIIENENISNKKRKEAINDLKRIMPEYNGQLDEEGKLIEHNTGAIEDYLDKLREKIRLNIVKSDWDKAVAQQIRLNDLIEEYKMKVGDAYDEYKSLKEELSKAPVEDPAFYSPLKTTDVDRKNVVSEIKKLEKEFPELELIIKFETQLEPVDKKVENLESRFEDILKGGEAGFKGFKQALKAPKETVLTDVLDTIEEILTKVDGGGGGGITGYLQKLRDEVEQLKKDLAKAPKETVLSAEIQTKIENKEQLITDLENLAKARKQQQEELSQELIDLEYATEEAKISANKSGFAERKALLEAEKTAYLKNLDAEVALTPEAEAKKKEIRDQYLKEHEQLLKILVLDKEKEVQDEILRMSREAQMQRIRNEKEGVAERIALLEKEKEFFLEDQRERLKQGEITEEELYEIKAAYSDLYQGKVDEANEAITQSQKSMVSTITSSLNVLSRHTEGTFKDWVNWIKDAIRAFDNLVKSIEAATAAQKALNDAKDGGGGEFDFSSFLSVLSSIGSLVGLVSGIPMAQGGVVPSGYPNDSYPAMLTSGEAVVPPHKFNEVGLGGGDGGNVRFEIQGDILVGMLEKMNRKNSLR